jgi:2-keto-4-pentenoate hydratase/2-oxohepta-3-ene-1,7-dioic acid hydratase in catechol pathway
MKLVTFAKDGGSTLGIKTERGIVDVRAASDAFGVASSVPTDIMEVIEGGKDAVASLSKFLSSLTIDNESSWLLDENQLSYEPCVTTPKKIICVGLNYRKHAEETNAPIPDYPILFNKFHNTLTGHNREIAIPNVTQKLDYEAELVIVIGKKTKNVSKDQALDHVFGYCCVNDLSARDLQLRTPQWMLGKIGDDFSPLGPYLVTSDEVGDPNSLTIKSTVNGDVRQLSNTSDMIFRCDEIVSYISLHLTLEPGDIILTGTPEGVVLGYPPEKQVYLQTGDVVSIEIEKLGKLTNHFIAES